MGIPIPIDCPRCHAKITVDWKGRRETRATCKECKFGGIIETLVNIPGILSLASEEALVAFIEENFANIEPGSVKILSPDGTELPKISASTESSGQSETTNVSPSIRSETPDDEITDDEVKNLRIELGLLGERKGYFDENFGDKKNKPAGS